MANPSTGSVNSGVPLLSPVPHLKWPDQAVKLLVPVFLIVLVAGAVKFGSLADYARLLNRQTYASLLSGLAAVYVLSILTE